MVIEDGKTDLNQNQDHFALGMDFNKDPERCTFNEDPADCTQQRHCSNSLCNRVHPARIPPGHTEDKWEVKDTSLPHQEGANLATRKLRVDCRELFTRL